MKPTAACFCATACESPHHLLPQRPSYPPKWRFAERNRRSARTSVCSSCPCVVSSSAREQVVRRCSSAPRRLLRRPGGRDSGNGCQEPLYSAKAWLETPHSSRDCLKHVPRDRDRVGAVPRPTVIEHGFTTSYSDDFLPRGHILRRRNLQLRGAPVQAADSLPWAKT